MPFIANFKLNVSLVRLWRLAAILITSVTLAVPPRAHSQTPQNLLDQKRQSATQPNYLLIQPQYPRPAMAPAVFYLLPL
ncbi:MAG: hypothetical protein SFT94_10995, partial [Pseudanabaenaceae cyanobacterium bins.68]|nr:hypothetical protein [Pseudanabaenaceae cyanobacterium bins.68]